MTAPATPMEAHAPAARRGGRWPRGIFRRYLLTMVGLVGASLLTVGAVSVYFTYADTSSGVERLQRARLAGARTALEEVGRDLRGKVATAAFGGRGADPSLIARKDRFAEALRRDSPFSELAFVDASMRERLRVRADGPASVGISRDRSADAETLAAARRGVAFGSVYERPRGGAEGSGPAEPSEPHFTLMVRARTPGREVVVAEVGLEPIRQRLVLLHQSDPRYRYLVVDTEGHLVGDSDHPLADEALNPVSPPYVARALVAGDSIDRQLVVTTSRDEEGETILTSHVALKDAGWLVFIQESRAAAFAPVRSAIARTAALVGLFLGLAALAGAALARRMTRPIRALTAGAQKIGGGALDQRIETSGSDELETLADEFNRMSARLNESYGTLEARVAERTRDLTASLAENAHLLAEIERRTVQLEAADRHKTAFLANVSHELRTPLNAIIGFSEVMTAGLAGEVTDRQAEYLQDINDSGRHLLALINDILDLSKVEAGRMELELGPVDVAEAIVRSTAMVRDRALRNGIALTHHVDPEVGVIVADARKLRQVVLNLVDNALRFTHDGGTVRVDARRYGGWIEITVSDTGVGIAPEDQQIIFEDFRQVGAGRGDGTGLGLSLARRIAELHGGSITVASRPGEGSVFAVRIPARNASPLVTA